MSSTLHVRLDERGAGFFALGRALVTGRPVVVIVTSGTAAAELHACVAEADAAFVPLIVVTADRPPDLHGVGAPQTMEQHRLYGSMVRLFEDAGAADFAEAGSWRSLAARLWDAARGDSGGAGPVHLNAPFDEPLVGEVGELPERDVETPRLESEEPATTALDVEGRSVLCVVGRGVGAETIATCRANDWVVLGDATARGSLPYFDALLRAESFAALGRPELVVRLGGQPASRVLADRLREWQVPTVALDGAGFVADPDRLVSETLAGLPQRGVERLRGRREYAERWHRASERVSVLARHARRDRAVLRAPRRAVGRYGERRRAGGPRHWFIDAGARRRMVGAASSQRHLRQPGRQRHRRRRVDDARRGRRRGRRRTRR